MDSREVAVRQPPGSQPHLNSTSLGVEVGGLGNLGGSCVGGTTATATVATTATAAAPTTIVVIVLLLLTGLLRLLLLRVLLVLFLSWRAFLPTSRGK
jgi:hypothetical protein